MGQKMFTGSLWSFGTNAIQQILILIRLIVLAHLLLPSDFGLLGIAVLTMYGLDVFSQTGLQQALVHKKSDITSDLNAVWTLLAVRGVLLFVAVFLLAPCKDLPT
jgi:O-antigen/teichoic acid export membrane protein